MECGPTVTYAVLVARFGVGIEKVVFSIVYVQHYFVTVTNTNRPTPSLPWFPILVSPHGVCPGCSCLMSRFLFVGPTIGASVRHRINKKTVGPTVPSLVAFVFTADPCLGLLKGVGTWYVGGAASLWAASLWVGAVRRHRL